MDGVQDSPTSSSRSWSTFVFSMFQSVLLFLFFWQGNDDLPVRDMKGLSRSQSRASQQEPKNQFPIEKTVELLANKINALNATFDNTITGQKGSKPTETLRLKLRQCITQITAVLAEIDQLGQPTDSSKINEERRNLSAKRRILQQRLSPGKVTTKIEEVVNAISQAAVAATPANKTPESKRGRDSEADTDLRQHKKSQGGGRSDPVNADIHHAPLKNVLGQADSSSETSSYTSTEYTSSEDELPQLPSLSLGLGIGLGDDLLAGLNKFGNTAQSGSEESSSSSYDTSEESSTSSSSLPPKKTPTKAAPPAEALSFGLGDTTSLLNALAGFKKEAKVEAPKNSGSSRSGAKTPKTKSPDKETSKTAKEKETPKEVPKEAPKEVPKEAPPKEDDFEFDFSQIQGRGKGRMMAKMMPPARGKPESKSSAKESEKPAKEPEKPAEKEKPAESKSRHGLHKSASSRERKSNDKSAEKQPVKAPPKKVTSRSPTVISDVDGGDTFALFRRMNELAKKNEPTNESTADSEESSASSWSEGDNVKVDKEPVELIAAHGFKEDMNKEGMRRGKKGNNLGPTKGAGKQAPRYQQEDTHLEIFPFLSSKNMALFAVFDGHAGKECSTALLKEFPKVFKKHWNSDWETKTDLTPLWKAVYQETDNNLKQYEYEGATSTTVLVWRCSANGKRYVQSANLGDSTSYLYKNGKAVAMSQDHKPTTPSERERILSMGVKLEPGQSRLNGLAVSRAFGDHFPKDIGCGIISEPYVSAPIELTNNDTRMILASDGLWDIVSGEQAFNLVKSTRDPSQAARKLVKQAVSARECHDNVTVVVVNLI